MNSNSDTDWKLVLLPLGSEYGAAEGYYERTYLAWKSVWEPVYKALGKSETMSSDTFTRQWDRMAIYHREECAAVILFNRADLSRPQHQDDSYFSCWPELARKGLVRDGNRVLVGNSFTVTPKFRKQPFDFDVKDLLTGLTVRYFLESPFDVMTGNMRNLKGMNEIVYRWGATPLMKDVLVNGEASDLVGFFRGSVKPAAVPRITDLMNRMWSERHVVSVPEMAQLPGQAGMIPFRRAA